MPDPLAPEVIREIERQIGRLDQPMDLPRAVTRLYHIADALASGPPPRDLFILAAAVALWGTALCTARDQLRPAVAGSPTALQKESKS